MKNLISCDKSTIAALADRLKRAKSHAEYQRSQCILIRATLGSTAGEIAQLLGGQRPPYTSFTRAGPGRVTHYSICVVAVVGVIST